MGWSDATALRVSLPNHCLRSRGCHADARGTNVAEPPHLYFQWDTWFPGVRPSICFSSALTDLGLICHHGREKRQNRMTNAGRKLLIGRFPQRLDNLPFCGLERCGNGALRLSGLANSAVEQ